MTSSDTRIPVTVLTGYLGAGKTTLLNRILTGDHGMRYAVIVNEFGEIGIDNDLVVGADEDLFEMNNGCVCCTVRGDLIRVVGGLMRRQKLGERAFDGIIVETTGLADPGPVAQTFLVDEEVRAKTRLDGVTTLVDARHVMARLDDSEQARAQVAFGDLLVVNKTDLVSEAELEAVEARLRGLNPLAPLIRAERAQVPLDQVLGRGGFDLTRMGESGDRLANPPHGHAGHVHDALCEHEHGHGHHEHGHEHGHGTGPRGHDHGDDIAGVSVQSDRPLDGTRLTRWLDALLAEHGADILRAKGIIDVAGEERRLVFQAVHMILEGDLQRPWRDGEPRYSRAVFIGRNLDEAMLRDGFAACVA
ncbi:MAG: CobW family GTP-binding protein [Brevundimonas sp.]|jgi:G3E family GTPase|uniref:CobW family GTP-binding protein n=1 Tax=Brevundimonas sp. TaxID=1871086 RepID=UPI00391CB6E4